MNQFRLANNNKITEKKTIMIETFEHSKKQAAIKQAEVKRKERVELLVSLVAISLLVTGYVTQHVLN